MKEDIKDLVYISKKMGSCPEFVQGGGGNISVKIDNSLMAIKASGYFLKNVTENNGFSFVDYRAINKHVRDGCILNNSEDNFNKFIGEKIFKKDSYPILTPSIETGFHAILPYRYIIHTHSVYANILCCCLEGKKIARSLFPDSIWVDYASPGKNITITIANGTKNGFSDIIFMQNHGIIVCSNNVDSANNLHKFVNDKIIDYFSIKNSYRLKKGVIDIEKARKCVIFPDQVVYLLSENLKNTDAGLETLCAYDYVMQKIKELKLTVSFISSKDIDYIENMESEKYRKSLV